MKRPVKILLVFLLAVATAVVSVAGTFYYQENRDKFQLGSQTPDEEIKSLIEKVGKIAELPVGETPTVATISDKEKLKDQAFFAQAENGDKVLIYPEAKKAYLYRPRTGKIVDIAPVSSSSRQSTP